MDFLEDWCKNMEGSSEGRLMLSNILYDCRTKRISKDVIRSLLNEIMEKWKSSGKYDSPVGIVTHIADENSQMYHCQGQPGINNPHEVSRVIESVTFLKNNISPLASGGVFTDCVRDDQIEFWEKEGFEKNEVKGEMQSRRAFAWVTKSKELEKLRKDNDQKKFPNIVRNALGLRHYNNEEKLLEICYPDDALNNSKLVPPTFIEGSPSLIYCSKKKKDGWGRTVHLETLKEGLPEGVHPPIKFNEKFKVKKIGQLTEGSPFVRFEDIEKKHPTKWNPHNYAELKKYL